MSEYVVIGLGNFGFNVAVKLAEAGHEVLVIDADARRIDQIKDRVTESIVADAREKGVLAECVNVNAAAVILNLGDTIEASALTTLHLRELGIKNIIVKVVDDIQATILEKLGATKVVNPEKDTACRLVEHLTSMTLIERLPLAAEYSIVEVAVPDALAGKTLADLQLRSRYGTEVIAIKDVMRDTMKLIPGGDCPLVPDSVLVIIGLNADLARVRKLFG